MKFKSRAAIALACAFALTPLAACNQTPPTKEPPTEEVILPVTPSEETPNFPAEPEAPNAVGQPAEIQPPEETPNAPEEPSESTESQAPNAPEESEPTVVARPTAPEPPKVKTADYLLVQANGLSIRTGAGTSYPVLGSADKGSLLIYAGKKGEWYETRYKDKTAYVFASYAKLYSVPFTDERIESVITRGFDFLGVKYVYGATRYHDGKGNRLNGFTTTAFDCSSYMQYIFLYGAGVNLNMTTRTQVTQGKEVKASDLKRGDLLFFTNASRFGNTGVERVGHVALYLGDNYILHTASDYARAEQITATRWSYYLTARRML